MEIKKKTIEVPVYVAKDGEQFETEEACIHHEKILNGERKECPICHGKGYIRGQWIPEHEHWEGTMGGYYESKKCEECGGKGWLEKKTIWS